jgi:hypothetical protein
MGHLEEAQTFYMDVAQWWECCVMKSLKLMVRREMAERNEEFQGMENFLYACMYDVLNDSMPCEEKRLHLNRYNAKLF